MKRLLDVTSSAPNPFRMAVLLVQAALEADRVAWPALKFMSVEVAVRSPLDVQMVQVETSAIAAHFGNYQITSLIAVLATDANRLVACDEVYYVCQDNPQP